MPETTQRTKSLVNQKRLEVEHNRTSLTPLFERHTLREGKSNNILSESFMFNMFDRIH